MSTAYSPSEGQALKAAIAEHFGACTCRSWHILNGARVWVETCAGHRFLKEPNRTGLLLGMRRDLLRLRAEEQTHDPHPGCQGTPREPEAPRVLPW